MDAERKRAYSHPVLPPVKRVCQTNMVQVNKSITDTSSASPPSSFFPPAPTPCADKENMAPFLAGIDRFASTLAESTLLTMHGRSSPPNCHPLQALMAEQYDDYKFPYEPHQESSDVRYPLIELPVYTDSPGQEVPDDGLAADPGPVIYENTDADTMGYGYVSTPLTTDALAIHDMFLSHLSQPALQGISAQALANQNRTAVSTVPIACFDGYKPVWFFDLIAVIDRILSIYDNIQTNDIVLIFDVGKEAIKIEKIRLCSESWFFASILSDAVPTHHIACVRLRNDFPWGIKAMLQFVETGLYIFERAMLTQFPYMTMLDLHIHAHLAGAKYQLPALSQYAVNQYVNLASMILDIPPFLEPPTYPSFFSSALSIVPFDERDPARVLTYPPALLAAYETEDTDPGLLYNDLLNSWVLLWRNTPYRSDTLRAAVLELITQHLHRLVKIDFFGTMMSEIHLFAWDVLTRLEEDGFDVAACVVLEDARRKWTVCFG